MSQKTDWFDAAVKPVHIGVYETTEPVDDMDWFSWWDGRNWNGQWSSVSAASIKREYGPASTITRWRGLAEPA